jgi:hypothetical protein
MDNPSCSRRLARWRCADVECGEARMALVKSPLRYGRPSLAAVSQRTGRVPTIENIYKPLSSTNPYLRPLRLTTSGLLKVD